MSIRNKSLLLKKSWIWEKEVEDLILKEMQGHTLNCPCGESKIGHIRVDIEPKDSNVLKADMYKLPFDDSVFDTVISDPPWKINYYHRPKQFFELVRVCKLKGKIIFNSPWIPESKYADLDKIYTRRSARFGNASLISIFYKTGEVPCLSLNTRT